MMAPTYVPAAPRQNELHLLRLFCYAKNQSPVPLFFLSAKSHARLSCSLINALTTLSCRYQLFAVLGACSQCSHNGEQTKSFRPPFSKGGRDSGQSPEPLSADSGTLLTKRFLKGIRETFSRKKFPFNFARNAFSSPQICR